MRTAAACAVLAVLELDAAMIAQTMVSRPLVVGAALGALTGSAQAGVLFGATFELLGLCDLPVGGSLTWSSTVAAGTATLLSSEGASFPLCFVGGLAAGLVHARVEALERARRASTGDELARRAESGGRALGAALAASLAGHAAMTFAVAGAVLALVGCVDRLWWAAAPQLARDGAAFISSSAPWIGLSGVAAWGLRRA